MESRIWSSLRLLDVTSAAPDSSMKAARAAGMWAIGVVPPYLDKDEHAQLLRSVGAHHVIIDPDTLPYLLNNFEDLVVAGNEEDEEL